MLIFIKNANKMLDTGALFFYNNKVGCKAKHFTKNEGGESNAEGYEYLSAF